MSGEGKMVGKLRIGIVGMVFGLAVAGCGKVDQEGDIAGENGKVGGKQGVVSEAGEQGRKREAWEEPYEETVTITTVRNGGDVAVASMDGDSLEDNLWTRSFKDVLNVDVKTDWTSADYDVKLNVAIAAGRLPDVFVVNGEQLDLLMESGQILELTKLYEEWGSERLKELLDAEASIVETAKKDGKLYAIPQLSSGYHPEMLWLRNDWLSALGEEKPKTMEDLERVLLGMKEFCGSGSYVVGKDLKTLYELAIGWDAYPGLWLERDGEIVYGTVMPEMKEALRDWQRWYEEGILAENFGVVNDNGVREAVVEGRTGAMTYRSAWGWNYGVAEVEAQGVDGVFYPCEIPTVTGEKAVYPKKFRNNGYIVINKNCEHPEAVLRLIDYYVYILNDAYAEGSMSYEEIVGYTANNMQHATAPFTVNNSTDDYKRYDMIQEALKTGDESVLTTGLAAETYHGIKRWIEDKDLSCVGYAVQFYGENSGVGIASRIVEEGRVKESKHWGASPKAMLEYGDALDDLLVDGFTRIIMGDESVDYFDTLVEQWYAAGGRTVTEAMNRMYGK